MGASGDAEVTLPFGAVRGRTLFSYSNQLTPTAPKRMAYLQLLQHLRAGDLTVTTQTMPLTDAAHAWERQRRSPGVKLVLRP